MIGLDLGGTNLRAARIGGEAIREVIGEPRDPATMVERVARVVERALQQAEVHQHAGRLVGHAADRHLGAVRMAVDAPAWVGVDCPLERVRGVEAELFGKLEHHGIPISLCVCRLSRQRGWSRQ